jgi:hypothetical protein
MFVREFPHISSPKVKVRMMSTLYRHGRSPAHLSRTLRPIFHFVAVPQRSRHDRFQFQIPNNFLFPFLRMDELWWCMLVGRGYTSCSL